MDAVKAEFICNWDGKRREGEPVRTYENGAGWLFCASCYKEHTQEISDMYMRMNLRKIIPYLRMAAA